MRRTSAGRLQPAWTEVAGRRVRSLTAGGSTDLPEIVLLPGLGTVSYVVPWLVRMGAWTQATLLDLPGWRMGRGRGSPSTVTGVADATTGWLRATDRRSVVLVGHSSGAQSAIRTALAEPDRLVGLVLASPTLQPPARTPLPLVTRVAATLRHERWSETVVVLPWYVRGGPGWVRLVRSAVADRPEDAVGALGVPTHVTSGVEDRLAPPAWGRRLAELAGGTFEALPDAHNTCYTDPAASDAAVHRAVLRWTATTTTPPPPPPKA